MAAIDTPNGCAASTMTLVSVTKPLSIGEIRRNVAQFAAQWSSETRERGESQSFWTELLDCFGISRKRQGVLFERPARRASTGKTGFIDVFWPGVMLAEQKSGGKLTVAADGERSNAEEQAFDYLNGGDVTEAEFPRYVLTSDFASIQVTDLEAPMGDPGRTLTFNTADFADHFERLLFLAGYQQRSFVEQDQEEASIEAARLMAALYVALTGDADTDETIDEDQEQAITLEASVLMTRLLFLMFGDDAGLWERGLFLRWVQDRTAEDGSDLGALLNGLFDWLNTETRRRDVRADPALRDFPYVNGSLFADREATPYFDKTMRQALLKACEFEWTRISPAVFGSLFQSIKSKQARRSAGEHYTTEQNILKTIRPLFLDELRGRLEAADTPAKLRRLHDQLGEYRFLDPACGCGNFLVVAYREMRQLELDLLVKLRDLQGTGNVLALDASYDLKVRLDAFHGIELHWWPAKIAETAMFLVDQQANRRMEKTLGLAPNRLPIKIAAKIVHGDALTTDWAQLLPPTANTLVFGNPPFLGDHTRDQNQLALLQSVWGSDKTLSRLDFVTGWHAKTLSYFRQAAGEWAFVTTNSIVQGDQAARLFSEIFHQGWSIKFAHRTFAWTSEAANAAAVHCVIIGFTKRKVKPRLFTYSTLRGEPHEIPVKQINAYLVDGPNVLVHKRTTPLSPEMPEVEKGSMPTDGGYLVVTPEQYPTVAADAIAAKYLRPYIGSRELLNGQKRWCLWLVDLDPADVRRSPLLAYRIEQVRQFRQASTAASTRSYPHHHLFRQFGRTQTGPFLGIPEVSSENRRWLPVAYLDADVIVSNKVYAAPDDGGLLFAVVSSSMFITWMKTVGGRMKSDLSFSSTITWNNFPIPPLTDTARAGIIRGGQRVIEARAQHADRSLASHYHPLAMDPTLVNPHLDIDRHLDRAFGLTGTPTEIERQTALLNAYTQQTSGLTFKEPRTRTPRGSKTRSA